MSPSNILFRCRGSVDNTDKDVTIIRLQSDLRFTNSKNNELNIEVRSLYNVYVTCQLNGECESHGKYQLHSEGLFSW